MKGNSTKIVLLKYWALTFIAMYSVPHSNRQSRNHFVWIEREEKKMVVKVNSESVQERKLNKTK